MSGSNHSRAFLLILEFLLFVAPFVIGATCVLHEFSTPGLADKWGRAVAQGDRVRMTNFVMLFVHMTVAIGALMLGGLWIPLRWWRAGTDTVYGIPRGERLWFAGGIAMAGVSVLWLLGVVSGDVAYSAFVVAPAVGFVGACVTFRLRVATQKMQFFARIRNWVAWSIVALWTVFLLPLLLEPVSKLGLSQKPF
jgi:hypothetical protein